MTHRRSARSRLAGGIQLEQLTLLAVIGLGLLGVMGGLGSAVSTTLIGDGSTAGGGSGSVGSDPLAGATWTPTSWSPGGADGLGSGGPEFGGGGIGGDEPIGLGGDGVGGDEDDGTSADDGTSGSGGPATDGAHSSSGDPTAGDPTASDPTAGDPSALATSDESRLDECDHPSTFANILRTNWDRVRGADRDKPDDRIDTEDLEAIAGDDSAPPDLRAAADFFLRNRALLHVLERGGEGGDDNGRIGRDDLDTAIAALDQIDWDAFRAGVDPDMSVEEAQAWLARFHIVADIAAGRGEIDGDVSHDDLRALIEGNECLGDGAEAAAQSVIDNVPEPEECSGFSLCHFDGAIDALGDAGEWVGDRWEDVHEIRRGVRDWVGDRIADGQRLANEGLTWVGDRATELDDWVAGLADNPWFRYNPLYWGVRGVTSYTANVSVPFTRGAVNGVFGIVDGLYTLGGLAEGLMTGDPTTYQGLYDFGHLVVTDPGAAWDQTFEVGRAIYNDYKDKVLACVGSDASVSACSEAIGELAPDIALTILTGGAGKAATGAGTAARFAATHADDVGRYADDIAGAANHIDDVASHADDVAGHADEAAVAARELEAARAATLDRIRAEFGRRAANRVGRSPSLVDDLARLEADGWTIRRNPDGGATYVDRSSREVVIGNDRRGARAVTDALAHETGHARFDFDVFEPYVPLDRSLGRDEWVRVNVERHLRDEGEATLREFEVSADSAGVLRRPTVSAHTRSRYGDIYEDYLRHGDRDRARREIAERFGNEVPSTNTSTNYYDYYAEGYRDFWDQQVTPPTTGPAPAPAGGVTSSGPRIDLPANNTRMTADEALDAAGAYLGDGYTEIAPGVFRSADGTRQVRMTDSDLAVTDNHAGAPHLNFEQGRMRTDRRGRESFVVDPDGNSHVYLEE